MLVDAVYVVEVVCKKNQGFDRIWGAGRGCDYCCYCAKEGAVSVGAGDASGGWGQSTNWTKRQFCKFKGNEQACHMASP